MERIKKPGPRYFIGNREYTAEEIIKMAKTHEGCATLAETLKKSEKTSVSKNAKVYSAAVTTI